ncbi:MAG: four helix bundle protein [Patescibacteria group bacterium]
MSNQLKTFKDLLVWQKSITLVHKIYLLTKKFPVSEQFGLTSQIRRASVSIPSNVAEGWMRNSPKYLIHFLRISLGSLGELETQIEISHQEGYINAIEYKEVVESIEEVRKMLFGFLSSINTDNS